MLYARQLGWLHAVPQPDNPPKGAQPNRSTRLKEIADAGDKPEFPSVRAYRRLVSVMLDAGPSVVRGMGHSEIGYGELESWQRMRRQPLGPWEALTVRRMSKAYVSEMYAAEKASHPAPFSTPQGRMRAKRRQTQALRNQMRAKAGKAPK